MDSVFNDKKEYELILRVKEVFMKNGLKSTTMDDVAKHLNVSKKTLYKYAKNRPDLIFKCFLVHIDRNKQILNQILEQNYNAIEEKLAIADHFQKTAKRMHPNFVTDAVKFFPKAWDLYTEYRRIFVLDIEKKNLHKGIKEGLYCKNMNVGIIARIYDHKFVDVFNGNLFPSKEFSFLHVYDNFISHHLRGISTLKGIQILDQKKAQL